MSSKSLMVALLVAAGCREGAISTTGNNAGAGAAAGAGGAGGGRNGPASTPTSVTRDYPCQGCQPFPGRGAPACAATALPSPKIVYPPDGVLLPPNMNVLEVQWVPGSDATQFQVEFHNDVTQVTVETPCQPVPDVRGGASRGCGLTLPQETWNDLADHNRGGKPVSVTVRATKDDHCVASSTDKIAILFAEEDLAGGIYYWQSATFGGVPGTTGGIFSHDFGARDPKPQPFLASGASGTCVGCHAVSRDGARMAVGIDDPDADDEYGDVDTHIVSTATRMTVDGTTLTKKGTGRISPGFQTFTRDHAKVVASQFDKGNRSFAVYDGDGMGVLANLALPAPGTQPDLAPDDRTLAWVVPAAGSISANAGDDHFLNASIWAAPFDAAANTLGTPAPLLAAKPDESFYYPSFSPSGDFLVLNAISMAGPMDDAYYNRRARVVLLHLPAGPGATPIELPNLNAPALGQRLTNSWPKWSPFVQRYQGHSLLWVTFSSNRDYGLHLQNAAFDNCYPPESPAYDQPQPLGKKSGTLKDCAQPQIWMSAIVVDAGRGMDGADRSFPAFWLPFQDVNAHNHTAQWVEKVMAPPSPGIIE